MTLEIAIVLSAVILAFVPLIYRMRPKKAFASVTLMGISEADGAEQISITGTIFEGESVEEWKKKVQDLGSIRYARLEYVNNKVLDAMTKSKELQKDFKDLKASQKADDKPTSH